MWTAVDFCPDPMLAFEEVLAVPVVVPSQTKMTSKSTTLESGNTLYRMNRSKELAPKSARKGEYPNPRFVDAVLMEEREWFEGEAR